MKCFCIDDELVYWNFFWDFGPLNLGQLYRFTVLLNSMLQDPKGPVVLFYSSINSAKRTNAIYLICAWQVLELKRSPEQAIFGFDFYNTHSQTPESAAEIETLQSSNKLRRRSQPPLYPLTGIGQQTVAPLPPFHDASPIVCTYNLTLMHCLQGLVKAKQFNFFDWDSFDVEEYEHFEQVEVRIRSKMNKLVVDEEEKDILTLFLFLFILIDLVCYTEWRFELDHSRQDSRLCWTILQKSCVT